MMRPRALLLAVVALTAIIGLGVLARKAFAQGTRYKTQLEYVQALNGSPTPLGWISSADGGSFTNWGTVLPDGGASGAFDAGLGSLLLIKCQQAVFLRTGNSGNTATGVDVELDAKEKFYTLLRPNENAVAIKPTASSTCIPCCAVNLME